MMDILQGLVDEYSSAIQDYLNETEGVSLQKSYELAQRAFEAGMGVLDIVYLAKKVLANLCQNYPCTSSCMAFATRFSDFLAESMLAFKDFYKTYSSEVYDSYFFGNTENLTLNNQHFCCYIDRNFRTKWWNKDLEYITGLPSNLLNNNFFLQLFTSEEKNRVADALKQGLMKGKADLQTYLLTKSGAVAYRLELVAVKNSQAEEGMALIVSGHQKVKAGSQHTEAQLKAVNRAIRVLSECNETLVRAKEETVLLQNICHIIVDSGGYCLAWVGYAQNDERKTVKPVAQQGYEAGYLESANITWDDSDRGRGPTGTAIRTGQVYIAKNIPTEPNFEPWRQAAIERGYASSIVLPLKINGQVFGALNIYAKEPDIFDAEEVSLLSKLADNLGYGIAAIRTELERQKVEANLHRLNQELEQRVQERTRELATVVERLQQEIGEREQAQKELILAKERLQYLLAASPTIIYSCQVSGNYTTTFVSDNITPIFGYEPRELIEDDNFWLSRIYAEDKPIIYTKITSLFERGKESFQYRIMNAKGEYRWIQDDSVLLRDDKGKPLEIVGAVTDITQRQKTQEALRESEQRWQLALKGSNDGIWDWNIKNNTAFFSELWKEKRGFAEDEIGNKIEFWVQGVHPDDRDRVLQEIADHLAKKTAFFAAEYRVKCKDNSYLWMFNRGQALWDEQGNPVRMVGSETDISAWKKTEESLRQQLAAVEAAIDGIGILNQNYEYIYLNTAYLQIFGYEKPEDLIGKSWKKLYFPPEIERWQQEVFPNLLQTGHWRGEAIAKKRDGSSFAQEVSLTLIEGVGLICVCRDISDRKLAEEQLQQTLERLAISNAQLARANRLRDEFLANMSHELRTPLNAILGLSEALREEVYGGVTEKQSKCLTTIEESGNHLLSLINDILDLAKLESGKVELELSYVNVQELCESSLIFVQEMAYKKDISLTLNVPEDIGDIEADELRLRQVLINLLSNAVKFTPEKGSVILEVKGDVCGERLCFCIKDTGIGIAPENISKLFQAFVQIDSSLGRRYAGTGLGLALVQRLVEFHGGTVSLQSELGVGSEFTVSLPWRKPRTIYSCQKIIAPRENCQQKIADSQALILLAEDNESNIIMLSRYLVAQGYQMILARTGLEAVNIATEQKPQLILMDIQLPEMNGLDAIKRLRSASKTAKIPILALTALAMPGDREKCLAAGASEYITKPVPLKQLVAAIETWALKINP